MPPTPRLPILVGITGHRDILPAALPAIRRSVEDVLRALKDALGASLTVVTALAEGADQLVATVALELGIAVIAISPMPLERYSLTMDSPGGKDALDRLWTNQNLVQRLELPLVPAQQGATPDPAQQDAVQYEQLGLVLSRQSHILLALWNGDDPEPPKERPNVQRRTRGGSVHVVKMRQMGERSEVLPDTILRSPLFSRLPPILEMVRSGPILHLVTPRQRDNGDCSQDADGIRRTAGALLWWSDLPAQRPGGLWHRLRTIGHAPSKKSDAGGWSPLEAAGLAGMLPSEIYRICETNKQLMRRTEEAPEAIRRSSAYLCPEGELIAGRDIPALRRLRDLFGMINSDASYFQARLLGNWSPGLPWPKNGTPVRPGMLIWFASAVPVATLCFELYSEYGHDWGWLALYLIVIAAPLLTYLLIVKRGAWQARYQDHRALAEGLRVQFFWAASGVTAAVSDSYLRHQTGMLGWIRLALRGPALDGLAAALTFQGPDPCFVRQHWIKDQMAYFEREGGRQEKAAAIMLRLARATVVALMALIIGLFTYVVTHHGALPHFEPAWVAELPLVALGTLPAVAAFFIITAEARAYEENAHAYALAYNLFAQAERQSDRIARNDVAGWRDLLLALGQEALTENANWIATHRNRPVASKIG